ncbi:GPO family capsid scaffolding protein [Comamonas sp. 17RB]|uniref:GPO family capsid scaffolding protein n=1 Tax=Comamonas sp. 17RB TaxID=3047025 RepID=UPI0024B67758|nr:GPO family capsid scaffolding protein [Comamonas sp. 17RB]MDI9855187.1 GPO family capsid scaffolding protein [Comamonas sp. 17RB]
MSKSKWFRVATEGATTDGRKIERHWIDQMAKNFSPAKYGARVWIEHMRGMLPESAFAAQGDVLGVQARTVEDGKLALFAQIQPLESLVAMNKKGQKLYTSIEVDPEFAGTGEAYLIGLAVTDSPASLGTEMLQFAAQHPNANPLAGRKTNPNTLFTAGVEFALELEPEQTASPDTGVLAAALAKFSALLDKFQPPPAAPAAPPPTTVHQHSALPAEVAAALAAVPQTLQAFADTAEKFSQGLAKLEGKHDALVQQLSTQSADPHRPAATGGAGRDVADY